MRCTPLPSCRRRAPACLVPQGGGTVYPLRTCAAEDPGPGPGGPGEDAALGDSGLGVSGSREPLPFSAPLSATFRPAVRPASGRGDSSDSTVSPVRSPHGSRRQRGQSQPDEAASRMIGRQPRRRTPITRRSHTVCSSGQELESPLCQLLADAGHRADHGQAPFWGAPSWS